MAKRRALRLSMGLSPLVRGTERGGDRRRLRAGSIPAGAGDGCRASRGCTASKVYPRWCGGRGLKGSSENDTLGLSPLVRGTGGLLQELNRRGGSIPAGAGDGSYTRGSTYNDKVYPRWCGGRASLRLVSGPDLGLSPLVRGTGLGKVHDGGALGSIPAGAGDGHPRRKRWTRLRVYPRWCGGRSSTALGQMALWGLSPLVRGTGWRRSPKPARRRVYPRWCGGRLLSRGWGW